ncbi:MAG: hypothetical protein ACUVSJ_09125 [Anaerolineae bacterium]
MGVPSRFGHGSFIVMTRYSALSVRCLVVYLGAAAARAIIPIAWNDWLPS